MSLGDFQRAFYDALWQDEAKGAPTRHVAFAVYRNTVMQGCLDALEANFPAVACLTGRAWFCATAAVFAQACPPTDPRMLTYGAGFPDFLASFEPARELVYLSDIARVDRLWTESFVAGDTALLDTVALRHVAPEDLARSTLVVHPATRALVSPYPVATMWHPSRVGQPVHADLAWHTEAILITRPHGEVTTTAIHPAALPFVAACSESACLAEAAERARTAFPDVRIDHLFADLLQAGAFAAP